jgi:hypothetical protein
MSWLIVSWRIDELVYWGVCLMVSWCIVSWVIEELVYLIVCYCELAYSELVH